MVRGVQVGGLPGLALLLLGLALAAAACSGAHKQPTGPAPEYEEAPPPSWLKDAGAPPAMSSPQPTPEVVPIPRPAPAPDGGVS